MERGKRTKTINDCPLEFRRVFLLYVFASSRFNCISFPPRYHIP
jgi:hypothetical protein